MKVSPDFDSLLAAPSFNRRAFLVTGLGAGFALATQKAMAQSPLHTDTVGLLAGEVKVPVKDGEMVAYRAAPANLPKAPVIIVVSEIFGVHEYIRDVCRRLAKLGYFAIAPELFARQGDPKRIANIQEILDTITARTPDAQVMSDIDATVAWTVHQKGADTTHLGVTGFCWGGRITWLYAAHNPGVTAAVAWYGRLSGKREPNTPSYPIDRVAELKAPVLGLYGGLDTGIPLEDVRAMESALKQDGAMANASEIIVYDKAPHAFHADYRPSYRKEEAEDGWRRMLAWFRKHGV